MCEYLLCTFIMLIITTILSMRVGFVMWFLSLWILICLCVNVDCVDVLVGMWICCLIEQIGCYVDMDWFLDVDLFVMWILLFNLSRGLWENNQNVFLVFLHS